MISARDMENLVDSLKMGRFRESTKHNYYAIWKCFNEFIIKLDTKPAQWEPHLTLFIRYMIQKKCKSTTIKSYISVIKAILMSIGVELNKDKYLLSSLIQACKIPER